MVAMLNKNLRTVLYYVVTVSVLCLMIEVTKRIPDPRTQLSPHYYEVVTASQAELATLCQRYTELRTTVDQRLRWAVGANPGLKEVADQFNCEQQVRIDGIKI